MEEHGEGIDIHLDKEEGWKGDQEEEEEREREREREREIRPNQKNSLFPVARPGHFSPKSRIFFLKMYACVYHVHAYICTHLSVPARGESNFSRRG